MLEEKELEESPILSKQNSDSESVKSDIITKQEHQLKAMNKIT